MPEREIRTVLHGMSYLECPRWHDGRLYVSDFYTQQVYRLDLDGGGAPEPVARVPEQPSGLGWMPDGSMLVVSMRDRRVLRVRDGGEPEVHADLSSLAPWHLNDMVVDPAGRAYVGNFGFDLMTLQPIRETGIIRVDPDGSAAVVADGLRFPNGTVIFPDGRTLVVAETIAGRLTAFDVGDDGALSNRRVWAQLSETVEGADRGGPRPGGRRGRRNGGGARRGRDRAGRHRARRRGSDLGRRRARRPGAPHPRGRRDRRGGRARDRRLRVRPRRRRRPHARHVRGAVVRRARAARHARGEAAGLRGRRPARWAALASVVLAAPQLRWVGLQRAGGAHAIQSGVLGSLALACLVRRLG